SKPGQGSTFTITIPETYDPANVTPRASRGSHPGIPAHSRPHAEAPRYTPARRIRQVEDDRATPSDAKRVLLVIEDDDTFAAILRDLSREMGFRTLVAGTADEAFNLARQFTPSAVILDIG